MARKDSTRAVIRNLDREGLIWDSPGDRFATQSKELFIKDSKSWLGDRSNLKTSTIDSADWDEVYDHFRESDCEGHESLDGAHMGETVYCDGSCT
jgi:hypothetical protein